MNSPTQGGEENPHEGEEGEISTTRSESRYLAKNTLGEDVGVGILQMFYGSMWESYFDRLDNQFDGYIISLFFKGEEFRVYRLKVEEVVGGEVVEFPKQDEGEEIPQVASVVG